MAPVRGVRPVRSLRRRTIPTLLQHAREELVTEERLLDVMEALKRR